MGNEQVTVELDPETADLVLKAARARGLTPDGFATEAVRAAARDHAAFLEAITSGDRDLAEGRVVTAQEMREFFCRGIADAEAELAKRQAAE